MHVEQYLYLFPSVLSALSWLSGNTGSSSMLVWQKLPPVHTSKSHLDLCIAGCQTTTFLFCTESARGLLPVFAALGRRSVVIIIWQVLCMHLVVCFKLMGCALFSCWKEVIKIPGKSFEKERRRLNSCYSCLRFARLTLGDSSCINHSRCLTGRIPL